MRTILINGRIVTETAILDGYQMAIEGERITELSPFMVGTPVVDDPHTHYEDVKGAYIMAGLIDIHSDMIEGILQPRSTSLMDFGMGLVEAEKQLAACGITTMFHSIAMFRTGSWDAKVIRLAPAVEKLGALIADMKNKPHLINNRYHLRYEMDNLECFASACDLVDSGIVNLLSIMDHSPGQGQYMDLDVYRRHLPGEGKDLTDAEFEALVKREQEKPRISPEALTTMIGLAAQKGISVASHDDDTVERVDQNCALGIQICEFPITLAVAKYAHERGRFTLLGAPNILRGKSHSGNLSATEAVVHGIGDILCSDYYPQALLRAIFVLADKGILPLHEASKLASLNPAIATGLGDERGSLSVGKYADLIVVSRGEGELYLHQTYVSGKCVLRTSY